MFRASVTLLVLGLVGCADDGLWAGPPIDEGRSAVVYDTDSRKEFYEVDGDPLQSLFENHAVALMSQRRVDALFGTSRSVVPSWGDIDRLCPDEPFREQPAFALCSGVYVGEGLVLTSEHCLFGTPVADLRVVFRYYYDAAGRIAATPADVYPLDVVARSQELSSSDTQDFAWLRFTETKPRPSVSMSTRARPVTRSQSLITISAGGGAPMKLDRDGTVLDARPANLDYFVASTDTFRGSSGAGAFSTTGELLGVFARGAADFTATDAGCRTTRRLDGARASERFTYVHEALAGLCQVEPWHPRCEHVQAIPEGGGASCAAVNGKSSTGWRVLLLGALVLRRRARHDVRALSTPARRGSTSCKLRIVGSPSWR